MKRNCQVCGGKTVAITAYSQDFLSCEECMLALKVSPGDNFSDLSQSSNGRRQLALLEHVTDISSPTETLIYGCGFSDSLVSFLRHTPHVDVCDSSPYVLDKLKAQNLNNQTGTPTSFLASEKTYDLVVAVEVIEHFTDPRIQMENLLRFLKPSGTLTGTTDFYDGLSIEEPSCYMKKDGHNTYWSPSSLSKMANEFSLKMYLFKMMRPGDVLISSRNGSKRERKRAFFFVPEHHVAKFDAWIEITDYWTYWGE
jgi:SAM-dependent methyltransferase